MKIYEMTDTEELYSRRLFVPLADITKAYKRIKELENRIKELEELNIELINRSYTFNWEHKYKRE